MKTILCLKKLKIVFPKRLSINKLGDNMKPYNNWTKGKADCPHCNSRVTLEYDIVSEKFIGACKDCGCNFTKQECAEIIY